MLLIAQIFAGYSLGEADIMRKAMGKKIRSMMKAEEEKFTNGALAKGYSQADAKAVFDLIEPFAGYAFNKAHSVSYGTIAYQTAYLKANYPEEYMTAVMMMAGTHERIAEAYSECVRLGIPVLRPDVNESDVNFGLAEDSGRSAIRYGLARVKNVGEGIAEGICEERTANGAFDSLDDFFERVPARYLNKRALESLVKAGAFDSLAERASLLASLDRLCAHAQNTQEKKQAGQFSLFDGLAPEEKPSLQGVQLEPVPEATQQQKLGWEKELLGIYLSEHPFARAAQELGSLLTCSIVELNAELSGREVVVGGLVSNTRTLTTRDGRQFIAAEIEDLTGSIEVTVWPETYESTRDLWRTGEIVVASVRVRENNDRLQIAVQRVQQWGGASFDPQALFPEPGSEPQRGYRRNGNGNGKPRNGNGNGSAQPEQRSTPEQARMRIVIDETEDPDGDGERLNALMAALRDYPGGDPVRLSIRQLDGRQIDMELPAARYCDELTRILGNITGPWGNVYA